MRAALTDPQGPPHWRRLPYAVPALLMLFAIFGPLGGAPAAACGVFSFVLFNLLGIVGLRQRRPRAAEITCGPGYVDVSKAGVRNQRIHARSIVGATTSRVGSGFALTLQHDGRDQPITLQVQTEAEVERIRRALGIGHGGFGTIRWRTQADNGVRAGFVGRLLAVITGLGVLAFTLGGSPEGAVIFGITAGQAGVIGAILGLVNLFSRPAQPSVVMAADGIRLKTHRGWFALPYDGVMGVDIHRNGLVFTVPPPYGRVGVETTGPLLGGLTRGDQEVLASQMTAAAQRAHGLGPHKNDPTGRVDVLRRNGESARDWLVRLDMAGRMLGTSGYRGNTLDLEDLWAIHEDPEAEPELRAAAARVLRHAPQGDTQSRIEAAVAAVRDESTNKRLRIALRDDVDHAGQELMLLDATDSVQRAQAMHARY